MSPEIWAAIIGIGGVIVGGFLGVLLDRRWYWRKARVSTDTGQLARKAVNQAKRVFAASTAEGGHLRYPWVMNDGSTVLADSLDDDLRQAAARVSDDAFAKQVAVIRQEVHGVWAATYATYPQVFIIGHEETPAERERRASEERVAAKQRGHAEAGTAAIEPALTILDKLERHS